MDKKAFGIGDSLILLNSKDKEIEYKVLDAGIYLTEGGTYDCGLLIKAEHEEEHWLPFDMFKYLNHHGLIFKEGHRKMAEKLREIRLLELAS